MNGRDIKIHVPLTFKKDVRNLADHTLVIEIEAEVTVVVPAARAELHVPVVDLRVILNINALDQSISLGALSGQVAVHRLEVPVIKLREQNALRILVKSEEPEVSFKLHRLELFLRH